MSKEHISSLGLCVFFLMSTYPIHRAVSMTIRFGTAIFAIPLDFIGMYCFECPICVRYSNLVLNNISIKEIRSTARWCAGLLRGIATRGWEIDFGRVINFCFALKARRQQSIPRMWGQAC